MCEYKQRLSKCLKKEIILPQNNMYLKFCRDCFEHATFSLGISKELTIISLKDAQYFAITEEGEKCLNNIKLKLLLG